MREHTPTDDPRWAELFTGGTLRRVTRWSEPVLHDSTQPVTDFDDDLHELIRDMFVTNAAADGVGLAATQVGLSLSLFIYNCPDDDGVVHKGAICNPQVTLPTGRDRNLVSVDEGCLSWPGGFQPLARPDLATCTGQDPWGTPLSVTGTGYFARCLQHETDHCNGIVFGDRLSKRSRRKLDEQHENLDHLFPEDWPVHPKG